MKEIRLLRKATITVLYQLAVCTALAGCIHFIFSLFWWLKNGVWTEDFIAVWIAMITSIKLSEINTGWVIIDKFFNYLLFDLNTTVFLFFLAALIFYIADVMDRSSGFKD